MSVTVSQIKQVLIDNEVEYLYHANTVATSISFLLKGGLLSRGAVEELNYTQTPQKTDDLDKRLGVYFDIFFDSDDIHARAKDLNSYGPVTFVYSINILDTLKDKVVKITKDNPIRWSETTPEEERYFTELIPMQFEYQKGAFRQHLLICDMHEPLSFNPYLVKIIIDNPNIDNTTYFDNAVNAIQTILEKKGINAPLEVRECPADCKCKQKYKKFKEGFTYYKFKVR
ncbi:MAG: hypothetical protein ACM677_00175 [Bacteroides sp.]